MGKIIIVTFAFMAFAFYELSGGEEFVSVAEEKRIALAADAERVRLAEAAEKAEREANQVAEAPKPAPAPASVPTTQLVLASASLTPTAEQPLPAALEPAKAEAVTAEVVQPVAEDETKPADIREVTAARVNMRGGPGQNFDVLAKLTAGEQVEILQDPGDGWVKLRVSETGRVGWMADFLLTASNN